MKTLTVPGSTIAPCWLNSWLATGSDQNRPLLYRTVSVEIFKTGVQLIASDGALLLGTFAPAAAYDEDPPPSIDEAPAAAYVVQDEKRRAVALMKFIAEEAAEAAEQERVYDIRLSVVAVDSGAVQTLDPSLDRKAFVIETETERLTLPIYEADWMAWRATLTSRKPQKSDGNRFDPRLLGQLGKLRAVSSIEFAYHGTGEMETIAAPDAECYLFGAIMPMKTPAA